MHATNSAYISDDSLQPRAWRFRLRYGVSCRHRIATRTRSTQVNAASLAAFWRASVVRRHCGTCAGTLSADDPSRRTVQGVDFIAYIFTLVWIFAYCRKSRYTILYIVLEPLILPGFKQHIYARQEKKFCRRFPSPGGLDFTGFQGVAYSINYAFFRVIPFGKFYFYAFML